MYESVTQNFYTSVSKKVGDIETCNFYMQLLLLFILWCMPTRERVVSRDMLTLSVKKESKNLFKKGSFACHQPLLKILID